MDERFAMQKNVPDLTLGREIFENLHAGLEISLIATPRQDLKTCRPDESVSDVVRRNTEHYDYLPVVAQSSDQGEVIIGLFHAAHHTQDDNHGMFVRERITSISESFVIGGDASILEFIKDADTRPCRLLVSGVNIAGLVSLSDLQRFPVRAVLFALITGFEITIMEAIRRLYKDETVWLSMLKPERRAKIENEKRQAQAVDSFVNTLLFTQFSDKKTILEKNGLESRSKNELGKILNRIERLRDKIAHANEYAATRAEAKNVCETVRALLELRSEISKL